MNDLADDRRGGMWVSEGNNRLARRGFFVWCFLFILEFSNVGVVVKRFQRTSPAEFYKYHLVCRTCVFTGISWFTPYTPGAAPFVTDWF